MAYDTMTLSIKIEIIERLFDAQVPYLERKRISCLLEFHYITEHSVSLVTDPPYWYNIV